MEYVLIILAGLSTPPEVTSVESLESCQSTLKTIALEKVLAGEKVELTENQLQVGGLFDWTNYYCTQVK